MICPRPGVRVRAADAIGHLGTDARPAIPLLESLCAGGPLHVRFSALGALEEIVRACRERPAGHTGRRRL
jgi:hypothetical protein